MNNKNVFSLEKQTNNEIIPLLDRATLLLETGNFPKAYELCETALNKDPRNAQAYTYILMAQLGINTLDRLSTFGFDFSQNENYQMALRFADEEQKTFLEESAIASNNLGWEQTQKTEYNNAVAQMNVANTTQKLEQVIKSFEALNGYSDSLQLIEKCRVKHKELVEKAKKKKEKKKKRIIILSSLVAVLAVFAVLFMTVFMPMIKYNDALEFIKNGEYKKAYDLFYELGDYKDCKEQLKNFSSKYDTISYYVDKRFVIKDHYTYDNKGNILSSFNNKGDTRYEYDSNGNCVKETHIYSNGVTNVYTYEYDSNGNCIKETRHPKGNTEVYTYEYDSNGNCVKETFTHPSGNTYVYTYEYDSNGNCVKETTTYPNGNTSTSTYKYDGNGNCVKRTAPYFNGDTVVYTYKYDNKGNKIEEIVSDIDGTIYGIYEWTYEGEHIFYNAD